MFINQKVMASQKFEVGLEVKNFDSLYLRNRRSYSAEILVELVSHRNKEMYQILSKSEVVTSNFVRKCLI